jgi:hypothetical protein
MQLAGKLYGNQVIEKVFEIIDLGRLKKGIQDARLSNRSIHF